MEYTKSDDPLESPYARAVREVERLAREDPQERYRYEAHQRAVRDRLTVLADIQKALQQCLGDAEDRREKLERRELIERVHLCQVILNRSLTPWDELKRLSMEELRRHVGLWDAERRKVEESPELLQESPYARAVREKERLAREDRGDYYRYQARLKAIRDQHSLIDDARRRGREAGELIGRLQLCQRLLKRPLTPREELTGLSLIDLRRQAEELEAEVFSSWRARVEG